MLRLESVRNQPMRRRGDPEIEYKLYLAFTLSFVFIGLVWTTLFASLTDNIMFFGVWDYLLYALVMLGIATMGMVVAASNDHIAASQGGFCIMACGLGMLLGPTLSDFANSDVFRSFLGVVLVLLTYGGFSLCHRGKLDGWWHALYWVVGLLAARLLTLPLLSLFGYETFFGLKAVDWVIIFALSGWIVYVICDARDMQWSVRNASDVAVAVYMDLLNVIPALLDFARYVTKRIRERINGHTTSRRRKTKLPSP